MYAHNKLAKAKTQRVAPPLIMTRKELLQKKLLEQLAITPMTRTEMADFLGVSVVFVARYITQLRTSKQIYLHHYERTPRGKPKSFYATGDLPDAPELAPIPQHELQKRYREQAHGNTKPRKFVPRMDEAAIWMKNPC
jgi:predicted ArsR family transcriptional regulator